MYTQDTAEKIVRGLQHASGAHVGAVLLHEFMVDLLGRKTAAALIFKSKADSDFCDTFAVSIVTKWIAAFILLVVNLGFLLFALLKGYSRGVKWQQQYVFACTLQVRSTSVCMRIHSLTHCGSTAALYLSPTAASGGGVIIRNINGDLDPRGCTSFRAGRSEFCAQCSSGSDH